MKIDWPLLLAKLVHKHGSVTRLSVFLGCHESAVRHGLKKDFRGRTGDRRDITANVILEAKRLGIEIPERDEGTPPTP